MQELNRLYEAGLPTSAIIRTCSPGLAGKIDGPVDRLGEELSEAQVLKILTLFEAMSAEVYETLKDIDPPGFAAALAAALLNCQRIVYDAALLRPDDDDQITCIPDVWGTPHL